MCRERLLSYSANDIAQLIRNNYLANLNAILNRQNISNRRTIFEQMILSFVRVLRVLNISEETTRFLVKILDKKASLLKSLNNVANQYCVEKFYEHNHNKIFEKVEKKMLKFLKAMLKKNRNVNVEWMMMSRLFLQLNNKL